MRTALINRNTAETKISVKLNLDGDTNQSVINTKIGFLDHMLVLLAKHSGIEMQVTCDGDIWVDDHHSAEDIGISLGLALKEALGEKRGIKRYADIVLPMDEALMLCAMDISGRGALYFDVTFLTEKIGTFDTELVEEFMQAFVVNAGITLHFKELSGRNSHHVAEACFKALGRTLRAAVSIDERYANEIPSTKGSL